MTTWCKHACDMNEITDLLFSVLYFQHFVYSTDGMLLAEPYP